jgi:hypothetical protein
LTTWEKFSPCPARTAARFFMACTVCSSMVVPTVSPVPLVHKDHLVADLAGEAEFVGDDHHGHSGLGQGLHNVEDLADELRIEG